MNYPPLWRRFAAMIYDLLLLLGICVGYALIYVLVAHFIFNIDTENTPRSEFFGVGLAAALVGFYCFFWLREGQTLGMKAWRLKVVGPNNSKLHLGLCLFRIVLALCSTAALGLGYWWSLIDKNKQTLHDKFSHTTTILLNKP